MSQSDAASEADDEQPISGEIQYGIPPRRYGLIIVAMLACIAVAWTTKEVVGSHHAKMERVPTDAIAVFPDKMKASAGNEPAWNGAGQKVGLQIWRIINFKVVAVPKDDYGEFYDGDSYIVLNTYEKDGDLQFDIHNWFGKYTTQDEYGVAAVKAVQLDEKLNDRAFTHREVMNHESSLFKSYFDSMKIVKGGADSGYREKGQKDIETILWVATKDKMRRVVPTTSSLKSENVYAIRHGLRLYQWNGAKAPSTFKLVAFKFVQGLFDSDPRIKITVLEERETTANHPAILLLQKEENNAKSGPATLPSKSGADSGYREKLQKGIETILWVATKNGMRVVPTTSSLKSENVYAIRHGLQLYQWNGAKAPSTFKLVAAKFRKGLFDSDPRIKITVLEERETTANHPAMLLLQK